ncbi:MAG: ferritin family protein [Leptospiraceae bacterium]|nr:ferritin family protein [Leptospiraceae bacterium]
MSSMKSSSLLDVVASAIQYEKDCFDFFMKNYESAKENTSIQEFFQQLAEDTEEHIQLIQNMYNELKGGTSFPNLKELTAIHKFNSTAIFKVMKKIERNVKGISDNVLENIEKAMKAAEDARDFYEKSKDKFRDPDIKILLKRLADYSEEKRLMIEAQYMFLSQKDKTDYYWDDEELLKEASRPA